MTGQETPPATPRWTAEGDDVLVLDIHSNLPLRFTYDHRSEIAPSEWLALVAAVTAANQLPDIEAQRDELQVRWHRCLDETDGLIDRRDQLRACNRALWDFVHAYDALEHLIADHTDDRDAYNAAVERLNAARAALGDTP